MVDLEAELRILIVTVLNLEDVVPEEIDRDLPLFGDGLGLDSIDALELGIALRKKYGIKIEKVDEDVRKNFATLRTLASFIRVQRAGLTDVHQG